MQEDKKKYQRKPGGIGNGPLSFHIRRLRQWYGDEGITQAELSRLAGLPERRLRSLEGTRTVPRAVESLLRVSLALGVPIDEIIAPTCREEIEESLGSPSAERQSLEETTRRSVAEEIPRTHPVVAACHRVPYLATAVLRGTQVLEVFRTRTGSATSFCPIVKQVANDYGCQTVLVEPDCHLFKEAKNLQCDVHTLAIEKAKELLLPGRRRVSHRDLCRHLVECDPSLRRFVNTLPAMDRIATPEPYRTVPLLAVALGRAYASRASSA